VNVPGGGDLLHQLVGVPPFLLGDRDKVLVYVGHDHARLVPHEGDGEQRFDADEQPAMIEMVPVARRW